MSRGGIECVEDKRSWEIGQEEPRDDPKAPGGGMGRVRPGRHVSPGAIGVRRAGGEIGGRIIDAPRSASYGFSRVGFARKTSRRHPMEPTMSRPLRPGRIALPILALLAIPIGSFLLGHWSARGIRAEAADGGHAGNREVSQKHWVSAEEIQDRFPAARHEEFMRKAIANSRMAGVEKRTGGAFGAVIVDRDGRIVAEGSNHVVSNYDPTWHGEMEAIRNACAAQKALKLDGCILYTSSEPCPMCMATAYWAGLDGIVYGAFVADSKKYGGFDDAFIYEQFTKPAGDRSIPEVQLLRDEAVEVWKEYANRSDNVKY